MAEDTRTEDRAVIEGSASLLIMFLGAAFVLLLLLTAVTNRE